jgi:hypothetical protein
MAGASLATIYLNHQEEKAMRSIRNGLLAGASAGILMITLLFFDEGPGNQLTLVAQSLGLDGHEGSKWLTVLIVFVVGALIGGLFGALLRQPSPSRGQAACWGLIAGALWWAVLFIFLGNIVQQLSLSLYLLMLYLVISLVYGLTLGSVYSSLQK